jgi:hypothetical protein
MQNKVTTVSFIFLFFTGFIASAQKQINTPFSRFNIGSLEPQGSFRSLGMGGTGVAMRDNSSIYFTNPASYSSIDTNSFVFDFGIDYGRNYLANGGSRYSSDDLNFHHLMMGFPLMKGWGIAVGFIPYSSGFYKITGTVLPNDQGYDPSVGSYTVFHGGSGGIAKYFFGTGARITRNISLGVNMTILSGELNRSNEFVFGDYYNVFHSSMSEKFIISGINFDYGVQYTATIKKNYFLNIGASLTSENNYKSDYNHLAKRYTAFGTIDTVSNLSENNTKTFIPGTVRLGVSLGKKNKFTTGIDYITTKWSKAVIPGTSDYAADTRELHVGAEYIPEKYSNYSFIKRVEYRIGGHIGDNYLIINDEQIKEYGVSIGIGLPMRRTFSKTNLFFDFTRKSGNFSGSLHREDYLTMGVSLNLWDAWFLKRKYD